MQAAARAPRKQRHSLARWGLLDLRQGLPGGVAAFGVGSAAILKAMKILLMWLLHATALLAVAHLGLGVQIAGFGTALLATLVIGLLNVSVRPVLVLLTLPVSVLTLGLFLFVINALLFWAVASVLKGFSVQGFGTALLGSLVYSALGLLIDSALERLFT